MPAVWVVAERQAGEGMKKLEIVKGRGRLYFDPDSGFLRMDYNGSGPTMELEREDKIKLIAAVWASLKKG